MPKRSRRCRRGRCSSTSLAATSSTKPPCWRRSRQAISEPLPPDHPLWSQPRAWITPHVAAPSEVEVMADEFAENYRRYVDGRELINVVDRERGY